MNTAACDLLVAGRGVNGDLAQATSSASTKLFHGGLRDLEYLEFGLVRKALLERETLLCAVPHIPWSARFVLPYHPAMRFEAETPASRLLTAVMLWMRGRRSAWLFRPAPASRLLTCVNAVW